MPPRRPAAAAARSPRAKRPDAQPAHPRLSDEFMATARKAWLALTDERKGKLADAIRLALLAHGPSTLSTVLQSCQVALKRQDRVQDWVTGEAVQGALYVLTVNGRTAYAVEDEGDFWRWRRSE